MTLESERLSAIIDKIEKCKDAEEFRQILSASENLSDYYKPQIIFKITKEDRSDLFEVLLESHELPLTDVNQNINKYRHKFILDFLISGNHAEGEDVINKRVHFIELLLESLTDDNFKASLKSTLYRSIREKDDEMFKALLEHGKLDLTLDEETQLVYDAMRSKSFTIFKILFEKDRIAKNIFSKNYVQDILQFIFKEAPKADGKYTEDSCNFIKALFDKLNQNKGPDHTHPFVNFCIFEKNSEVLKPLIESNIVRIDTIIPSTCWTGPSSPLENFTISMAAAQNDNICLLNILKEEQHRSGKATSIFDQADSDGRTVAHYVRSSEAATIVRTKNNINHKDKEGNSPLFHFLLRANLFYYDHDHDPDMIIEDEVRINAFKLIENLIEHSDLSNNKSGQTILHALSKIKILANEKQRFTDLVNKVFTRFEATGMDISQLLTQKDERFEPALLRALHGGKSLLFKLILKQEEKYKVTNLVDEYILEEAIISGSKEIVEHLLSQEVDLKSLIPEEILVDIAKDFEENKALLITSPEEEKCLALLNETVKKLEKNTEVGQKKIYGRMAFSETRSLCDHIKLGSVAKVKSILPKAGPASRIFLSSILREFQTRSQNDPSMSAEKKQCIDLLADTVKKLEDSKNVNNSDKSQVNGKKSLAEYFRSFIKWVQEGLRKMYNFLTGNTENKIKNNSDPNKDNKKLSAPGATPAVAERVKKSTKK